MEIIHVIKKLNNTELGKGGTNDSYVMVPKKLDVSDLFPEVDTPLGFIFKKNGDVVNIRHTTAIEKRIVGLGEFYRKNLVCAGDEILFERQILHGESRYYIDLNQKTDVLVLQRVRDGFSVLTPERMALLTDGMVADTPFGLQPLKLEFIASVGKRKDSPDTTDIYDLRVGDTSVVKQYSSKRMMEIRVDRETGRATVMATGVWKKYRMAVPEA